MSEPLFPPSRTAALRRLADFVPKAAQYGAKRNYDVPDHPHVSTLSPYLRHRVISEEDVLQAVLGRYAPSSVDKFVQEVFWRTYWKGWLEMRPSVWADYKHGLQGAWNGVQTQSGLRTQWEAACKGETGIDCFDAWARELVDTGYLHNHARMWFASIWIFTLRLPWELGADFFLRHLLDGDPASNTCSWRWVGGLHTVGKTYLARPDNIAKYTQGRFHPTALASHAPPLTGSPNPERRPLPDHADPINGLRTGLLVPDDDLGIGPLVQRFSPVATAYLSTVAQRSPLSVSPKLIRFVDNLQKDTAARFEAPFESCSADQVIAWAKSHDLQQIVMPYAPVGPARDAIDALRPDLKRAQIVLSPIQRAYDRRAWPHATHGFFRFKDKIPQLLGGIKGIASAQ